MSRELSDPQSDGAVVLRWPQRARSVPMARRELRRVLAGWEWGAMEDVASLVLSELLTNAVRHGQVPGREIETRFVRVSGRLRIEVHDASGKRPLPARPVDGAGGGWGLPLVDSLAAAWGVGAREAGVGGGGRGEGAGVNRATESTCGTPRRARLWALRPDRSGSGPITEAECTTCLEGSGAADDGRGPALWCLAHTQATGHTGFRRIRTDFFRAATS